MIHNLIIIMIGILVILIASTMIVFGLEKKHPEKDWTELKLRIKSWWVMASIFTIALLLNRAISIIFMAFLSFLALKEYLSLIDTRRADRRVLFWAYLTIPIQYFWVFDGWYGMFIIFIPVYVFLILPIRMLLIGETRGFLKAISTLQWGLMLTVFSISHMAFYMNLSSQTTVANAWLGPSLILYVVILTQLNDVSQYVFGKLFGSYKVVPKISPNKSWEGFLGGVITTSVLAILLAPLLTPMDWLFALFSGLLISISGFIGDINVSAIKRDLQVKDSGQSIPGHGGILDRIDSLTYTAPLFFHFIRYFYF